jgi:hypothetical protein
MSKFNSQALRRIAEDILEKLAEEQEITDALRGDFTTSLVRQWITYEGNATLFIGEKQLYFVLGNAGPEQYRLVGQSVTHDWKDKVIEKWKVSRDDLPKVIEQLNRGQSAEVTNTEGVPLRLWVNPKERNRGVESLTQQPTAGSEKEPTAGSGQRDYLKIARNTLKPHLSKYREEESEKLACSVANQWQRHEGHACLFLSDGGLRLLFILTENGDGGCRVATEKHKSGLSAMLSSLGLPPGKIPEVIACINMGQEVEFQNKESILSILWHDPKERRIGVRPKESSPKKPAFDLGVIEIHEKAAMALARSGQEAAEFLRRHALGDWGDISDKATAENNHRLRTGQDIVSAYHTKLGDRILVCTTADRQRTVVYV